MAVVEKKESLNLSDEEIFRILENPELNKFPPSSLGKLFENNSILLERIRQLYLYYRAPSQESRAVLSKGIIPPFPDLPPKQLPAGREEIEMLIGLSSAIQVDEIQCVHLWNAFLTEMVLEGQKGMDPSRLKSIETIIQVRDFYFSRCQYLWKILQEIIRIDGDKSHVYHEPISRYLDKLLEKGLVSSLLLSVEKLYHWDHHPPNYSDLQSLDISPQEFSHFKIAHRTSCAEDILHQIERFLETALLLVYCRPETVTVDDFHRLITVGADGEFSLPKRIVQLFSQEMRHSPAVLSFKWILLFSAIFQFWRLHSLDSGDISRHLLIPESGGSTSTLLLESIDGIIFSLGRSRSGSVGYQTLNTSLRVKVGQHYQRSEISDHNEDQNLNGVSSIIKLLWGLFLKSFNHHSAQSAKRCLDYLKESRRNSALEYLVQLSNSVLGRPCYPRRLDEGTNTYEDNPLGSDMTIYCIILQEVVNALVDQTTFEDENVNMDAIASLIELIYRSDEQLCACFWSRWISSSIPGKLADQSFPACKLIKLLAETSFHEPQHLLKILLAITCSNSSSREVSLLLSSPVSIVSWVPWDHVRVGSSRTFDGSIHWTDGREWLRSNGSKAQQFYLPILLDKLVSRRERVDSAYLVEPSVNNIGIILQRESHSVLVKWQCESTWLALLMNIFDAASSLPEGVPQDHPSLLVNALNLFGSIVRYSDENPLSIMTKDWNHLCLYSFLRGMDALEYYPLMSELNMTVKDVKRDPRNFIRQIRDHGGDADQAQLIAERSHVYHFPEFNSFVIEATVNLMFTFISSLTSFNDSVSNSLLDNWRELLAASLSLLSCIAVSIPSSSHTLTILRSVTKTYRVEDWTELLSHITSTLEGTSGRYDVTKQACQLLSALLRKVQTPLPANSLGLVAVFHQFDLDGNGAISPEELQKGLVSMGYEVPISAVDHFFQRIDADNSSAIHFSKLLHYATASVSQLPTDFTYSLSEAAGVCVSDLDRAQFGLSLLLQEVIYPESRESSQLAESLASAVTNYSLDCLAQINRWTYLSLTHRSELTSSCLRVISTVLTASSPLSPGIICTEAAKRACDHLLHRFANDKQLQESMLQSCLNLSLTALQVTFTTSHRENSRSLKSFISEPTSILPGTNSGGLQPNLLPVSFSRGLVGQSSPVHVDLLEEVTLQTIHIFHQILDIATHPTELEKPSSLAKDCAIRLLELMFSSAGASATGLFGNFLANPLLTAHSSSAITNIDLPCLNFAVLASLLDYPTSPLTPIIGHPTKVPTAAAQLLTKLTAATKLFQISNSPNSRRSFVDGLGYQNVDPICLTICSWIKSKTDPGLKYALLDLLLTLCQFEPLMIVLLLKVPSTASAPQSGFPQVRPENSLLASTIEKLLQRSEYLYEDHPILLAKLYELILCFIEKSNHLSIGHFVLNLCKSPHFWDSITIPLMHDISATPRPDLGDSEDASQCLHGFSIDVVYERSGAIPVYCARLHAHALALRILARERFGTMFFIDTTDFLTESKVNDKDNSQASQQHAVAEKIEKTVDGFFEKANSSHRFLSWVKHYMQVDFDYALQKEAEESAKSIGVNLGSLLAKPRASSIGLPPYGGCYIYSHQIAESMMTVASFEMEKSSPRSPTSLQHWKAFLDQLTHLNCMWSVADTQMVLLRSWREFIEVYVQSSPNRPASYIKSIASQSVVRSDRGMKRHESFDSRDSNSDDDQPGTPKSIAHSESQASGAHSPSFSAGKNSPQSPTRENTSSFTGDKRSYELVSEVIKQLSLGNRTKETVHENEDLFSDMREGFLAANVAVEKCNLLVSMLHHQLKHVSYRTTDPSRARVLNRDTGSTRLKSKKMLELLQALAFVYRQYVVGLEGRPPTFFKIKEYHSSRESWLHCKRSITLRLLTAILLLHQGLKQSISDHLTVIDIYLPGYQMAVEALKSELSLLDSDAENDFFSGKSSTSGNLSTSLAIIQVSFRLLKYVTPTEVTSLTASQFHLWREHIETSGVIQIVLGTMHFISENTKSLIQPQCNFTRWEDTACSFTRTNPGRSEAEGIAHRSKESPGDLSHNSWDIMDSILDYILSEGMKAQSLLFDLLIRNGLLNLLNECSLFHEFKRILGLESTHKAAALMGYHAQTCEASVISSLWCKIIRVFQCSLRLLSNDGMPEELILGIQNQVSTFISSFGPLLLLSFPDGKGKISLRQLEISQIALVFFCECDQRSPICKVHVPAVVDALVSKVLRMIGLFSLLLGDGDDKYSNTQQRTLHSYMLAVSQQEKRFERRHAKHRVASKLFESGADADLVPSNKGHQSHSMIMFIADAIQAILGVCEPAMSFIRTVVALNTYSLNEGYGVDSMNGKLHFRRELSCLHAMGSRIVYRNPEDSGDAYCQGIVHSVDQSGKLYTIRSLTGTLDYHIPCQNVFVHTSTPFLNFEPSSCLPRYVETDSSTAEVTSHLGSRNLLQGGYISYKGDSTISTSTAHLVRLLKFARHWEGSSSREQRSLLGKQGPDVDHLCGELVWVLVMTIADHSWMGNDSEALIKQLEEIDGLIQLGTSANSHWIASENWNHIRDWLSRMIGRIVGPLRSQSTWSYDYTDMEESFETIYLPTKQKRLGSSGAGSLRAGVSFVDLS